MKRSREVVDGENIPACIVVLKPHHSNLAREGQQYSSHGGTNTQDGSTLILHLNSTPEILSSSFSTAAAAANSSGEVSEVWDSSSKGIQPADCSTCGVSVPLISDRPGIIVHGDGGKLGEEPKKERRKKEKRKKHRPKVVEIEKPEKKSKMETPNAPETPQQKSLGWKKSKIIGRTFAGKKMVADSLDDENNWEEVDDQPRPASANKPVIPSSRIQIDGDELAAKVDVEPSSCSGNAQMVQNSAAGATNSSTDVNLSVDELLQELAKLLEKPLSPLLLKEELLLLNMESFVDALKYIVDNISIPFLLYFVNQSRRRMARSRPKVGHKLKEGLDHSTNEVLEKFIYVLMKFLPFLVLNNDLSQAACRKFNNSQNGGSRRNIIGLKEQQNTPKKSSISKAQSNFQIIPSTHQHHFTSRFQCMEALWTAPANFTINRKLTRNWQNISSNCMELALENIIDKFKVLDINRVYGKDAPAEPHCALVPFVGDDMIVPYEGPFERNKQKQCRAEVLLDPVSDRVLKFLQENEGSDDVEGMDFSMFKWWENERRVFVGRAKSFIARLNLILGDRRFSPWKGSIVDSVVGVFLTQNVSDHLSSSAFMSLAAKFPLHSRVDEGRSSQSKLAEQHEERSNDAITFLKGIPSLSTCDDQDSAVVHGDGHQKMDLASQSYHHQNFMGPTRIENCENFMEIDVEGCITKHAANLSNSFVVNAENECRDLPQVLSQSVACSKLNSGFDDTVDIEKELAASCSNEQKANFWVKKSTLRPKKKVNTDDEAKIDWECLRRKAYCNIGQNKRNCDKMDSVNWEAVRNAEVSEISAAIRERGMYNLLAERIKDFLNRLVRDHGSIDLEWLRNCPDEAKKYLLSIRGLGLKSVECIRLLALQSVAFPVDTNVARISVRLGWVPLKPLPEFLQLHLLEQYPIMDSVQKYIWPRLCKLDQKTLYELHYHMITFGKVFCTKSRPNCSACPMRGECKHFTSAKLALPAPEDKQVELPSIPSAPLGACGSLDPIPQLQYEENKLLGVLHDNYPPTPIIEEPPPSPSRETIQILETDIEDAFYEDDEIPVITLNMEKLAQNLQNFVQKDNLKVPDNGISRALVEISAEVASIPIPKLKNMSGLRTEHHVYELRDSHPLLKEMDQREPDDQSPYLLAIWTPGETAQSTEPPESLCESQEKGKLCDRETCFSCNNRRELEAQTVRGTVLIPCRTAMRGRFPLNGTYFQINEVFADHDSSRNPIHVPRSWLWNLPRRTVYFGTSVAAIFRGFSAMEPIQFCFSRGFICVRGFDRKTREPKPLYTRLHLPRSKAPNNKKPWVRQEE